MKDLILIGVDCFTSNVRLTNMDGDEFGVNRVHINLVEALTKGGGAKALAAMCHNADELDITLSLNACPLISDLYHTQWLPDQLVDWYGRRGFRRVSSRHPNFNFMGRLMVRPPMKAVIAPVRHSW